MASSKVSPAASRAPARPGFDRSPLSPPALRRRLNVLRWLLPLGLLALVGLYEIGPARWIGQRYGPDADLAASVLVYGTVGPLLAFKLLDYLGRWLAERETSDLQARLLAQTREQARLSRQLSDNAVQALFAASVLLSALDAYMTEDMPPETAARLGGVEKLLSQTIEQLRAHLVDGPPGAF